MSMGDIIARALKPIRQRLMSMIVRGILDSAKDGVGIQLVKTNLRAGETREDMERLQNYGMTSHPPKGSEVLAAFINGDPEHGFVIACEHRNFRFKPLAQGEVAIYTDEGDVMHFKRGGTIQIIAAAKVDIDAPAVEIGAGTLEKIVNGETFQGLYNAHTHLGNLGVPTGPPQVQMSASELSQVVKGAT